MNMIEAIALLADHGITEQASSHTWPSGASSDTLVLSPKAGGYPYVRVNGLSGDEVRWVYIESPGYAQYPPPEECIRLFKAHDGAPKCGVGVNQWESGRCERWADSIRRGPTSLDDISCMYCPGPGQERPDPWKYY